MTAKPNLSVIIPAFNEAAFIGRTVAELALLRNRFGVEIILADDGSTDGTPELARPLVDAIAPCPAGAIHGPGAARNRGAALARADLLFFIDADIRLENPDRFVEQLLERFQAPELIAATCRLTVDPALARRRERVFQWFQAGFMRIQNELGLPASGGWGQAVRRWAFERAGGYDASLQVTQDYDLFMRLRGLGKIRYYNDLRVLESPRRYRREGIVKTAIGWILNPTYIKIFGRPMFSYRPKR